MRWLFDPKKEHAVREEGEHPEWELEIQTEGLEPHQIDVLEVIDIEEEDA